MHGAYLVRALSFSFLRASFYSWTLVIGSSLRQFVVVMNGSLSAVFVVFLAIRPIYVSLPGVYLTGESGAFAHIVVPIF